MYFCRHVLIRTFGFSQILLLLINSCQCQPQITALDAPLFLEKFRDLRGFALNFIGTTGNDANKLKINSKRRKIQPQYPSDHPFFCNTTGMRSPRSPKSVDKVRPGDIDIVGAIGDSLTAGNGVMATNILEVFVENKGLSWSIGGQGTWRQYLTLPNILKEFNPNLYGYPTKDGISIRKASRFNAAEGGAMSQDIPQQAKNLVKRMLYDPKVDVNNHWKLITLLIGGNDFCSDICYLKPPEKSLEYHENNILAALRTFRDYLPRTIVNLVASPNVDLLTKLKGKPQECVTTHVFECPCFMATQFVREEKRYIKIIEEWNQLQMDIASREEFQNKPDFSVVFQPFIMNISIPDLPNGDTDVSYLSMDCFHLSQKGYARAANALWNNMLEPVGAKSMNWVHEFSKFKCPTPEMPYLRTPGNS